jgi:hypothetical protein
MDVHKPDVSWHTRSMTTLRAGSHAAALGGLLWVVAGLAGWGGDPQKLLYAAGSVCLAGAFGVAGYALVTSAPVWLRAVISVATPAFGAMVWVSLRSAFADDFLVVLVAGLAALAVGAVLLRRVAGAVGTGARSHRAARRRSEPDASAGTS